VALKDRKNEEELCAIPWSEMKEVEEGNYQSGYNCSASEEELEEAPRFTESEIKTEQQNRSIFDRIKSYYVKPTGRSSEA